MCIAGFIIRTSADGGVGPEDSVWFSSSLCLTVSPIEGWGEFGPGGDLRPALRSDVEVVVGVGAEVKGQVTVSLGNLLALMSVHPAVLQNHQLKIPEGHQTWFFNQKI